MGGLKRLPNDVGFIPNLNFNAKNLFFIVSKTLACVRMPVYVYACIKLAYTGLEHAYTYTRLYICMPLGFHGLYFPKIVLFSL